MSPRNVEEYFNRRRHHLTDEEYTTIAAVLKRIDEAEHPPDGELAEKFRERGNVEYRNGGLESALESYTQAILHDPNNAVHWSNRAAVYSKLGMVDKAIEDCENGLRIDDQFVKLYIRLGMLYVDRDEDKAYEIFGKGLAVDPDNETLKRQRELLVDRGTSATPADNSKDQSFEGLFEKMGLGRKDGMDLGSLLADKDMGNIINNVLKNKSPQELAEMVESLMGSMDILGKDK